MKNPHFVLHLGTMTIVSLLMIALGLLYYYDIEDDNLSAANAMVIPREYLRLEAEKLGFDYTLLERIVDCESDWKMIQNSKSSAFGYFQILDRTEKGTPQFKAGKTKFDALANIDMGLYLYGRYGTQPWSESKPCWGRY